VSDCNHNWKPVYPACDTGIGVVCSICNTTKFIRASECECESRKDLGYVFHTRQHRYNDYGKCSICNKPWPRES